MSDVSRETQRAIDRHFPSPGAAIRQYVEILTTTGVQRGLIGPRETPRVWERHILNCAVIAPIFGSNAEVADVGSGAGLPGLVLAMSRPDLGFTLIEPLQRRATFLFEVIELLDLPNVSVLRARAEDLHGTALFDAVCARAVAPLPRLARWALPLCRPGGELVAMKGARAVEEVEAARPLLRELSLDDVKVEQYGEGVVAPLTTVIRIRSRQTPQGDTRR